MTMNLTPSNLIFSHALETIQARFPVIHHFTPSLSDVPDGTVLSGTVWSALRRARWIIAEEVHVGYGVTYIDLARSWIELNNRLPLRRKHVDNPLLRAPVPLLAWVGKYEDCVYVDIKSTYKRIIELVGYDVEYRAGKWLSQGNARSGLEELPKVTYSSIVALSANWRKTIIRKTSIGLVNEKVHNKYANVCLYTLTRDVLHCIYSDVVRKVDEVFYANTDGYIVREKEVEKVYDVLGEWGFEGRVKKQGDVEVYGVGTYAFGGEKPLRRIVFRRETTTELADVGFCNWLRTRFGRLK